MVRRLLTLLLLTGLAACGHAAPTTVPPPTPAPTASGSRTLTVPLGERPFLLHVPPGYRTGPLVVLLHGYGGGPAEQEQYFALTAESDRRGFLYAMPEGTSNRQNRRFWNASPACCNFYGSTVDDSSYLHDLIDSVTAEYNVDRVFLVGHSNGGFMSYRMACDHADQITAIVSLAGAMIDATQCRPSRPVTVLQIHGDRDETIRFGGGGNAGFPYPSAQTTISQWRGYDGCAATAQTGAPLDLVDSLAGSETVVTTYQGGCRDGTRVELWTIKGGTHVPALNATFGPRVLDFLYAQPAAT